MNNFIQDRKKLHNPSNLRYMNDYRSDVTSRFWEKVMIQDNSTNDYQSIEYIFQVIQDYQKIQFSELLKKILKKKEVSIKKLFYKLQEQNYYMNRESLYRYFNSNPKCNRFPPKSFILAFSKALHLSVEQTQLLLNFWLHYKFIKKCNCNH
ncbi:hypothetical protein C7H19_11505 [Aphanothece hegewaldii CCALA 016]|uniref:Uncharacterized protein n=1 Tax=Aphanothece hegewaldii CCALA 016 TaxID=2107694 RepID=A0A2T1LXH2_9CHRO|nr:hypothetical protein C7H19_11505 [Aphanothece hegewaldii CCALA 016]